MKYILIKSSMLLKPSNVLLISRTFITQIRKPSIKQIEVPEIKAKEEVKPTPAPAKDEKGKAAGKIPADKAGQQKGGKK
jgi:hypothetical protein